MLSAKLVAVLILTMLVYPTMAQTGVIVGKNGVTSVKFTAKKDFVIGLQGQTTRHPLELTVDYDEAAKKIDLKASGDSVSLTTDMNFEFFRMKLDELVKGVTNQSNTVAISSTMEVYYWVYTLVSADDKGPRSGFLTLDQYVMVLPVPDKDLNGMNGYRKRTEKVDALMGEILQYNSRLNYAKEKLLADMRKQFGKYFADNPDVTKLVLEVNDFYTNSDGTGRKFKQLDFDTSINLSDAEAIIDLLNGIDSVNVDNETTKLNGYRKTDNKRLYAFEMKHLQKDSTKLKLINRGDEYDLFRMSQTSMNDAIKAEAGLSELQKRLKGQNLYKIKDVQLQFEKGFLERVQITVEVNGRDQIFENIYAIGFSSPADYKALSRQKLFIRNNYLTDDNAPHYIYLGDVLQNYDNELNNYTRDYSPADTSLRVKPEENGFVVLYKERLVNLFEAKVYTDLIGVLQEEPNGLIQIEMERRFNLLTTRKQLSSKRMDVGFLNYMTVSATVSKIENKQRKLILQNDNVLQNNQLISPSFATNLDFRRYENFGLQTEFNLFLWDYPDGKTMFYFDPGFRYSFTPVQDSVRSFSDSLGTLMAGPEVRDLNAHLFTLYPKFTFEFFAERRYGFSMSYQFNHSWLFSNNQYKQVRSYEKGDNSLLPIERSSRNSHQIDLFLRIEPNPKSSNGKIFARARFFMQQGDVNTFFSQIQIGYAYNFIYSR